MLQKVIQVGNSLAVTIPRDFIKAQRLKAGHQVFVEADSDLDLVQVRTKSDRKSSLTPEFKAWLDKTTDKHAATIKELAKK